MGRQELMDRIKEHIFKEWHSLKGRKMYIYKQLYLAS